MTETNRRTRSSAPFHMIVKPVGAACNLKCDYCFYLEIAGLYGRNTDTDVATMSAMSPSLLELLIQQCISAQPESAHEVHFAWQGGEPTLCGIDFFRRVVEIQKKYTPPGVRIENGFQTNGVLIDEQWAEFFAVHGFLVGLSLDGPEHIHNAYRKNHAGQGSFTAVMRALELLEKHDVQYNTLTCVNDRNAKQGRAVYRFLKETGSRYLQFIPIVEPDHKRTVSSRSVKPYEWGRFLCEVFDDWKEGDIGNVFVNHFDATLAGHVGLPAGMCVYNEECGCALITEYNGDVYSCDHFVDPAHLLGNITETALASMLQSPFQLGFGQAKRTQRAEACSHCEYLRLCYGECPKNLIVAVSGSSYRQNWLCHGFKEFYHHSETTFAAMARALRQGAHAADFKNYL